MYASERENVILARELWEGVEGVYAGGVGNWDPGLVFQSYCCRDRPAVVCPDQVGRSRYLAQNTARRAAAMAAVRQTACTVSGRRAWQVHPSLAGQPGLVWPGQSGCPTWLRYALRNILLSAYVLFSNRGKSNAQDGRLGLIDRPPFCLSRSGFLAPTLRRVGCVYCRCGALVILLVGRQSRGWQGSAYSSKAPETRFPLVGGA